LIVLTTVLPMTAIIYFGEMVVALMLAIFLLSTSTNLILRIGKSGAAVCAQRVSKVDPMSDTPA
jgi:hypothetical protein